MALPAVGSAISLSQIQTEYGGSNPISLSEYYDKGNAPGSGAIDMSADFGGTSNAPPDPQTFSGAGTSTLTIADNVQAIGVQVVGPGGGGGIGAGGGGAGSNMGIRNGGAGGAGYVKVTFYTSSNPPADISF